MHERHGRRQIATVLALATVATILPAGSALAGTRLINFDDRAAPSVFSDPSAKVLTNEYASKGVTFAGPVAGQGGAVLNEGGGFGVSGHSSPNFLAFNTSTYAKGPETITFANPAHSVEIKTGQSGGGTVTATAFNGTTPVSSSFRTATPAVAPLNLSASRITSVKLEFTGGAVIFDDLKWGTAPISGDESLEVTQGQVLTVGAPGVLGNDSDPDPGDTLTPAVARQPGSGTVDLRPDGSFTYTPNAAFFGTDSFTYRDGDGTGTGNEATVTIKVNQLPPPPPPPPPPPALRTPAVTISFELARKPTRVSVFKLLQLKNIPKGSRVSVVCLTKKGKRCKGKLKASIVKRNASGKLRLKKLQRRKYPAGSRIDATITNPKFKTQYKTLVIRKRSNPSIVTRCSTPPSKKRRAC